MGLRKDDWVDYANLRYTEGYEDGQRSFLEILLKESGLGKWLEEHYEPKKTDDE